MCGCCCLWFGAAGCCVFDVPCLLSVVLFGLCRCVLFVVDALCLFVVVVCCRLLLVASWLFVGRCALSVVRCLLWCVVRCVSCSLFAVVVRRLLLVVL